MRRITFQLIFLIIFPCLSEIGLMGQDLIGDWKSHLSFSEGAQVADAGDRIYCATSSGLFFYHKTQHTPRILTKVEGLSGQDISSISYDPLREILVVAYRNANIDLLGKNGIENIPDIKRKQMTGNKTIHNSVIFEGDAYMSCGFGIVVVNLEKKEIKDTYYIGENEAPGNVFDMAYDGTWLYAATGNGIYRAEMNSPNLVDFNSWSRITDLPEPEGPYSAVTSFAGRIFVSLDSPGENADLVYLHDGVGWNYFPTVENSHIYHVGTSGNNLVVITRYRVAVYDAGLNLVSSRELSNPNHALLDTGGMLWIADRNAGMIRIEDQMPYDTICPDGPLSNEVVSIALAGNMIYTVAGGVTGSWGNTYNHAELNISGPQGWWGTRTSEYRDLIHVSVDPGNNGHVFASSWGYGLFEYLDGELLNVFDEDNSTLQSILPGEDFHRLGGSVFDDRRNLWVTNSNVAEPISVLKPDGQWLSYSLDGKLDVNALGRIIRTGNGYFWVLCHQGEGLFAFDVNGTLEDLSDDSYRKFDILDVNGKMLNNYVYSIAEDKDGNIWVGTEEGVVVYYSPSRIFSGDPFYASQIIVPRNDGSGLADILLQNERVTAIAVDGANRKWVGTYDAGVFLLSEDGLEELHHFTREDSPLFSDNIRDIAIDGEDGTVYIATENGMISYRSNAIEGKEFFSDVYVYPNPVRQDFSGEIVITGLLADVKVKITDISGNIVFETTSLGGQAIWDGRTFSGERVSTGVYLIFCTREDGSRTHITKLLVIN